MKLDNSFCIEAPKAKVWEVFMDAEQLASCIPGVEGIRVKSETEYEADMAVKIQFMTVKFHAMGKLVEAHDQEKLVVELIGKPIALAGLFRNQLIVRLKETEEQTTEVHYEMDLQMTGRLATFGLNLIKGTVEMNAKQFANNVQELFQR